MSPTTSMMPPYSPRAAADLRARSRHCARRATDMRRRTSRRTSAGVPRIEVTFLIDANGILNVTARDMRTSQSQSIDVKPSYGLADDEVERMIEDSFKFAQEDVTARKLIEARLDAGALIVTTNKSLSEGAHLVAQSALAAVRAALATLTVAKDGNDPKAIRARIADLELAAKPLSVALLDDSLKRSLQGKKVTEIT